MKPYKLILSVILLMNMNNFSQIRNDETLLYYRQNSFWQTSPGAMKYGLHGFDNPAVLSAADNFNMEAFWVSPDKNQFADGYSKWGLFAAVPHLGFGYIKEKIPGNSVSDYKLSAGLGNSSLSLGLGYGWSTGNKDFFNHSDLFTAGILYRPLKYFSFGLTGNFPNDARGEGAMDLAFRPFGNEKITLFGDYAYRKNLEAAAVNWSAGAALELIPGVRITGRYFEGKSFNAGVQLSFGNMGFSVRPDFNSKGNHAANVYGIRIGGYDRNIFSSLFPKRNYAELNLLGNIKYQRFILFDDSKTLLDLLRQIDAAKRDNSIEGIAINTSGMEINREMLWELRERLKEFKSSGKHVVVYIDRIGINGYHLASVADKIVIDPQGIITLEGYLWGRSYYKGTLEKLGIGFSELRFFKYKSAGETFAEEKMTEADSTQWQEIINDFYATAKNDICEGRKLQHSEFDTLVNGALFLAGEAVQKGLADRIGRWDTVEEIIKELEGDSKNYVKLNSLEEFKLPSDNYWGEKPKIAVIYAVGVCAMDEGIKARELVKDVETASGRSDIKAVVFRVESPGGDALASDLVAEALLKCSEKKAVIVTQGSIAGSGGYWLSMYGDTILAAPNTITGSIGVIGAWYYDKGLKEKLGITTDYVKYGEHADLGFGFSLPLIGNVLPDRDLNEKEKKRAKEIIMEMYREFLSKAASGRKMNEKQVDEIGQGRVWSGADGLKNGLIDKLGGLADAVKLASEKLELKEGEYEIVEYPEPELFDFGGFAPKLIGTDVSIGKNHFIDDLKFRLKNNGLPLPLLPLETIELIEPF